MNNPAIEAKGLYKKYGAVTAVTGIDLAVRRGEIFGLVGADGAGKTSAIQMLCTLSRPSGGTAAVLGMDTVKEAEHIKPKIGYMSERFSLYGTLTVEENLDFFARLRLVPAAEAAERKKELLGFSRLEPFRRRHAEQLSGGMQKKLALCCCLIHQPDVIFMDEPTSGVDPISRRDFWLIISRFLARGVTFLVSTPYLDEAERFSRVALMHQGRIIACDTPAQLKTRLSGELLQIKTADVSRAMSALRDIPGVSSAQIFGESIHLLVDSAIKRLPEVTRRLEEQGLPPKEARQAQPGLEDVFVMLLGEAKEKPAVPALLPPAVNRQTAAGSAIAVSDVTRKFGEFTAVDRVTFEVKPGEIYGLLGPNGSGKTTTIRMLCGLIEPTSGKTSVLGQDMAVAAHGVRAKMGYMTQKFSLFQDLTVAENIRFYGGLYGLSRTVLAERKNWVLEMAGLNGKERLLARDLSGGWKQRLALGCAVIHDPSVVFLDEPTAGVDPLSRRFLWELIQALANRGTTVLITTHYMDEAEHCHRLGLMYRGQLIASGSPFELKSQTEGKLLEVRCSDFSKAVELLMSQPAYHQVGFFGNTVHLAVDETTTDYKAIQQLLESSGISVESISEVPFDMEDVFVSLMEKREAAYSSGRGA